ncbi:MAG: tetratricopeptide repeat protein [Planctomycetota bacterium]
MSRSPFEPTPDDPASDDDPLDRYLDGWARLNASMRRGESWSGGERNAAFLSSGPPRPGAPFDLADVAPVLGLDHPDDGRSAARIDVDFDGDDDLVVSSRTGPRVRVLANRLADGAANIAVRLVGTESNREAAGAVVFATPVASEDSVPEEFIEGVTQRRSRTIGSGYLGQSSAWLRFAFGAYASGDLAARARSLRVHLVVRWPGGDVEDFGVVRARRRYVLTQGTGAARESSTPPALLHAPAALPDAPEPDGRRRVVLPATTSFPSLLTRSRGGRAARLFGITPRGPRGIGRPVVVIGWDSADPDAIEAIGDIPALVAEAEEAGVALVAMDLAAVNTGPPDPLELGATRLAAAGWRGEVFGATASSAAILPELVGWRLDRTEPPPGPWSLVVEGDGRLAMIRTGAWREGDLAADVELLSSSEDRRASVSTPYPGLWANPPGIPEFTRFRSRLERRGLSDAVRELNLARVTTPSIASAEVQIRVGRALLGRGDLEGALARFDGALEAEPENVLAHRARAYTLHLLERYAEALAAWNEALRLDPDDTDTRGNRALAAVAAGELDVAREDLTAVAAAAGEDAPITVAVRRALALALRDGGDDGEGDGGDE